MRSVGCVFHRLLKQKRGALAIWFASSLVILVGITAFAVEVTRYYSAQLHLQRLTSTAAEMLLLNVSILSELDQEILLNAYFHSALQPDLSASSDLMTLETVAIDTSNLQGAGTIEISASASLLPVMLSVFQDAATINIRAKVIVALRAEPLDVALLIDSRLSENEPMLKSGGQYLSQQFESLESYGFPIRMGIVPSATLQMNAAPHTEWLSAGQWPDAILPPNVPGDVTWTGDLADQTWCVVRRGEPADTDSKTPSEFPFETSLIIDQSLGTNAEETYSIRFDEHCPQTPIRALKNDWSAQERYIANISETSAFLPDRGMVWARRVLDRNWQDAWQITEPVETDTRKVILVLTAGPPDTGWPGQTDFINVCDQLKQMGSSIHIVDFSGLAENSLIYELCASKMSYAHVTNAQEFEVALGAFVQTLIRSQIMKID